MSFTGMHHMVVRVKDFDEGVTTWRDRFGLELDRIEQNVRKLLLQIRSTFGQRSEIHATHLFTFLESSRCFCSSSLRRTVVEVLVFKIFYIKIGTEGL